MAIEEPESHLHSGAIHSLVDVISKMAENNQVIITTHNPLFVQQNDLSANIIVDNGTAHTAKNIAEIRKILGVLSSDNLKNSRYVVVVEGEDDKIALNKILPAYGEELKSSLRNNQLVIKSLGGASNLSHDLYDLKNAMCKFVVLLDNDKAGIEAFDKAKENGVIKDSEIRFTICNGSPEAEFEDCIKVNVYLDAVQQEFGVNLSVNTFKGSEKWSERVKRTFLAQGIRWTDTVEKKVKLLVANSIPTNIDNVEEILVQEKASFIKGFVTIIENMMKE